MAGDDALLVGGHDQDADGAVFGADLTGAFFIGLGVQAGAEPGRTLDDRCANGGGMLADAAGKDQQVQAAERAPPPFTAMTTSTGRRSAGN